MGGDTKPLFAIPIKALGKADPAGSVVCTEPAPAVYLLTFTSPPDNRLTTPFCRAMLDALDMIEFGGYPQGVVVTTSGIPKFYSNGLDLAHAIDTPGFWTESIYRLWRRLLTYPLPTVALVNGHAFAGGLMTAMHHDYRVMSPSRGFACLNEVEFGAPLKAPMSGIFRLKVPPQTYRSLVLEARRFGGKEALEAGIVDATGGLDEVLRLVKERSLATKAKSGVYGALKRQMYRENVRYLTENGFGAEEEKDRREDAAEEKRKELGAKRCQALKGNVARL